MDDVARMQPRDRRDLFTEAAARRGNISAVVIEKDFWVCWTLKHIFALGARPAQLIFKGGTSLSKVYHVIERFSEDIDLSLSREDLGFVGERDPYRAGSGKKQQLLVDEIVGACRNAIAAELVPQLHSAFERILGSEDGPTSWSLNADGNDPQTGYFNYPAGIEPAGQGGRSPYVQRVVRLELGARSEHWPAEEGSVRSYAAEVMPEQFKEPGCRIRALSAQRTFWEKATLLHAEAHRPLEKALAVRLSRHYYDLAKLYQSTFGPRALADRALLANVVDHKSLFFRSGWANYATATAGSFRLVPPAERMAALKADYQAMRTYMIFGDSFEFEELMAVVSEVEAKINEPAATRLNSFSSVNVPKDA